MFEGGDSFNLFIIQKRLIGIKTIYASSVVGIIMIYSRVHDHSSDAFFYNYIQKRAPIFAIFQFYPETCTDICNVWQKMDKIN